MAGIAFELERYLKKKTITDEIINLVGKFSASIGPWLVTVACLIALGWITAFLSGIHPVDFFVLVTYSTCLSQIVTAPVYSCFISYLSDQLFLGSVGSVVRTTLTALACAVVLALFFSFLFVWFCSEFPVNIKILFISLSAVLAALWMVNAALSSLEKYRTIFYNFLIGSILSIAVLLGVREHGLAGLLFSFFLGVSAVVFAGMALLLKEYPVDGLAFEGKMFEKFKNFSLSTSVFVFYLGVWADKMIFWFMPETSAEVSFMFRYSPSYDFPFFVAFLIMTVVATFVMYLGIDSFFKKPYEEFIRKLIDNYPFTDLSLNKELMVMGLNRTVTLLIALYGSFCIMVILLVEWGRICLPWDNPFVFQNILAGTLFFSLYSFSFNTIQFLNKHVLNVFISSLFLIINISATTAGIFLGEEYYGLGFLLASLVASAVGLALTDKYFGGLEYVVFKDASNAF